MITYKTNQRTMASKKVAKLASHILILSYLALFHMGCANKVISKYERGDLIQENYSLKKIDLSSELALTSAQVENTSDGPTLSLVFKQKSIVRHEWLNLYKNIVVYANGEKAIAKEPLKEPQQSDVDYYLALPNQSININVDGRNIVTTLNDGEVSIALRSIKILKANELSNLQKVDVQIGTQHINIADDLRRISTQISETKEKERTDEVRTAEEAKRLKLISQCSEGLERACNKIEVTEHSFVDLAEFSLGINKTPFKYGVAYAGSILQIVQKIKGGYLVKPTSHPLYSNHDYLYRTFFLKTKKNIQVTSPFCGWFYYEGDFTYRTILGASETVATIKFYEDDFKGRNNLHCFAPAL